jgi:hypothetical protein
MVTSFVIDRERWLNGDNPERGRSVLRAESGAMCCLGFYAEACGLTPEQLDDVSDPSDIGGAGKADVPLEMQWLVRRFGPGELDWMVPSDACNDLTWTNDMDTVFNREQAIERLFELRGIKVEFTGGSY